MIRTSNMQITKNARNYFEGLGVDFAISTARG